jgi:hypothetical protein
LKVTSSTQCSAFSIRQWARTASPNLRGHGARGHIKAPLGSCAGLGLDPAFDHCDGGEFGKAVFAWKAPFAVHPIDSRTYEAATLLNAAMPLIHIGVAVHGGFVRIVEKAFHFRQKAWLVGLHCQEVAGFVVNDGLGDAGVASDGIDSHECIR